MAKNNNFTFLGWFFFVVVKNHQKSMFEFNLESVFLSHFLKKRFYFADFPEDTLKTCPHDKFTLIVPLSNYICLFKFSPLRSEFWNVLKSLCKHQLSNMFFPPKYRKWSSGFIWLYCLNVLRWRGWYHSLDNPSETGLTLDSHNEMLTFWAHVTVSSCECFP